MARAPLASFICIRSRSDSLCDDENDHPASSVTRWAKDAKDVSQAKDAKCNGGARPPLLLSQRRAAAAELTMTLQVPEESGPVEDGAGLHRQSPRAADLVVGLRDVGPSGSNGRVT